jgi:hypothetical protein
MEDEGSDRNIEDGREGMEENIPGTLIVRRE